MKPPAVNYKFWSSGILTGSQTGWCKDGVSVRDGELMFGQLESATSKLVGGNGTTFISPSSSNNFGLDFAQADLPGQVGYFTLKA